MAKIKDCVVIEQTLLEEIQDKLYLLGCDRLADACHNFKQLEPIIVDTWNKKDTTLHDYLNEKEI